MIEAVKLLGAFDSNYIADVFYHTYNLTLPHVIAADITNGRICYVVALITKLQFAAHSCNGIAEQRYLCNRLFYQVQN